MIAAVGVLAVVAAIATLCLVLIGNSDWWDA